MIAQPVLKTQHNGHELLYAISNDHCAWRVKTLETKEADTVAWISSMKAGEVFVDVGANIGIYSVLAAKYGCKVYAFEPEAENYVLLCRSILFNDDVDITAYCVALSNETRPDYLYLSAHMAGGSCHTVGENIDHRLTARQHEIKQGCMMMRLDDFRIRADHLKIDVDGLEHKVISGAEKTLENCKSVLLEINQNLEDHRNLCEWMRELGFHYDPAQVEKATRKEGTFKDCGNWIFYR